MGEHKAVSIHEIRKELGKKDFDEVVSYCLRLARFKKDNKELLDFLLFKEDEVNAFVEDLKQQTSELFSEINHSNVFFIKKSVRKILRLLNKNIRFTLSKQVEAELLIHFCNCIHNYSIPLKKSRQLSNLYEAQRKKIEQALSSLHPDLQYDLRKQIEKD